MGEKNLWSKLGLIIVIVGLSLWQLYPPTQRLKPGIDLGGGHSLLFEIDDRDDKSYDLAQRVMTVLKDRVDPQGNRNLVWRPIGRNRLEIQMPRPVKDVATLRSNYEAARAAIRATNITEMQVRNALSLPPDARQKEFARMSELYPSRTKLFDKLVQADENYQRLSAEFASLPPATTQPASLPEGATQPTTQPAADARRTALAKQIDEAFDARARAIQELMATNLDERILGDLLRLPPNDSKRIEGLRKIHEAHPDLEARIQDMIAAYDAYAEDKGALDDPSDLIRLLRGAGVLEFRILATISPSNRDMLDSSKSEYVEPVGKYIEQLAKFGPRPQPGDNYQWFEIAPANLDDFTQQGSPYVVQEYLGAKYVLAHSTKDMGLLQGMNWSLRSAMVGRDRRGRLSVDFRLGGAGPALFGELTSNNINRPLAIFLDGKAMSAANIMSAIYDSGQISGNFSPEDVTYLVNTLEAGALPARLKEVPLQEKSIGPALGETNRKKGVQAITIAFLLTVAFMAVYYTYNGFIADIALLMNLIITLGIMSFLQATFTLPGIAGLVLSLGMAVDANVLIYERMREELARGVSVRMAVKLGYEKAFSAILDSNVTTIITAVILAALGSEEIKGFGLTLGLGLGTSMFTALFVTRQYLTVMVPPTLNQEETRRVWLTTGILVAAGALILGTGYLFTSPEALRHSTLYGLGTFLAWIAGTAVALVASIWLFRLLYRGLGHQQAGRLPMFKLFEAPNIKWMAKYRAFWTISAVVIGFGVVFMTLVPRKSEFLDIEFIGGTTVQVELNKQHQNDITDEKLLTYINGNDRSHSVGWLNYAADQLAQAKVEPAGQGRFLIATPDEFTTAQLRALLLPEFGERIERGGMEPAETGPGIVVRCKPITNSEDTNETRPVSLEEAKAWVAGAANYARSAASRLRGTRVQLVEETTEGGEQRKAFELITTETQRQLVAEALLVAMSDILEVTRSIEATLDKLEQDPEHTRPDGIFPVPLEANVLSDVIGGDIREPIQDFKGGVALVFKELRPPQTTGAIEQRLREMRLQPDFEGVSWRDRVRVVGLDPVDPSAPRSAATLYSRVAILVNDPQLPYVEGADNSTWRSQVAERELELAQAAFASTRSLQRVTQFAPQVAEETAIKAIIAILLSLLAIAIYVWVRFGSADFGVAGIIALYHDVAVALTCLMACHYLHDSPIGRLLMLEDFKIDLNVIAALLTIVGFSINDTIVIFDRIRENRGRLATVSDSLIDDSLNQTLSRTLITSLTVFMGVAVMYIFGGTGIHGFAFTMLIGTISGVYSTLGVATPMLRHPRAIWITTIILSGLTLTGLVWLIPYEKVCWTLTAIIVLAALFGLYRQFAAMRGEPPRRMASP